MGTYTIDREEFSLGMLMYILAFIDMSVVVTDANEPKVLGRHELIIPPREVGHLGNEALRVRA
jgi:hypothetical protein